MPYVGENSNPAGYKVNEEEQSKEGLEGGLLADECDINKRLQWCNKHECAVKSMTMTSKKSSELQKISKILKFFMESPIPNSLCPNFSWF